MNYKLITERCNEIESLLTHAGEISITVNPAQNVNTGKDIFYIVFNVKTNTGLNNKWTFDLSNLEDDEFFTLLKKDIRHCLAIEFSEEIKNEDFAEVEELSEKEVIRLEEMEAAELTIRNLMEANDRNSNYIMELIKEITALEDALEKERNHYKILEEKYFSLKKSAPQTTISTNPTKFPNTNSPSGFKSNESDAERLRNFIMSFKTPL